MLSYAESVEFVRVQLQIHSCEALLSEDKYRLLCEIVRCLHEHSPFHNFFLMAQDPDKRRNPSWDEMKSRMMSGAGGLCYPRNVFTFYLLQALGYDVILVMAQVLNAPSFDHVAIVARHVRRTEDRFLVDAGFGWPSLEPVDLSFGKESQEFTQSHYLIKYLKEDDKLIRLQRLTKADSTTFTRIYEMCFDACHLRQVDKYMELIYTPKGHSDTFQRSLHCSQYDNTGKIRIIQDNIFKKDTDDQNVEKFHLHDDDALVGCVLKNFPGLNKSIVVKALANWRKVCVVKSEVTVSSV